jgi:hypothetical protein
LDKFHFSFFKRKEYGSKNTHTHTYRFFFFLKKSGLLHQHKHRVLVHLKINNMKTFKQDDNINITISFPETNKGGLNCAHGSNYTGNGENLMIIDF